MKRTVNNLTLAAALVISAACGADEPPACTVNLSTACSPLCPSTQPLCCNVDSTRWLRATFSSKSCGAGAPEFRITSLGAGSAQIWNWHRDEHLAYVRGECGPYEVTAYSGSGAASNTLQLTLPPTPCPLDTKKPKQPSKSSFFVDEEEEVAPTLIVELVVGEVS